MALRALDDPSSVICARIVTLDPVYPIASLASSSAASNNSSGAFGINGFAADFQHDKSGA
jgi:hypothetical protein